MFVVGQRYTRQHIYEILGISENKQGGDWDTGYHREGSDWFIFATLGVAGRTGHDYPNQFEGDDLKWSGTTGARLSHPSIQSMISGDGQVFIFFRNSDRDPFQFAGLGSPKEITDVVPVRIKWRFTDPDEVHPERPAEELPPSRTYPEGAAKQITVNAYERNPQARRDCVDHYGTKCQVCGFDFEAVYGAELGKGYIHVHHLVPLSQLTEEYRIDPIKDLRPVCPNCHTMLHRRKETLDMEELAKTIAANKNQSGGSPNQAD